MRYYEITFNLRSPVKTPFHSDTIFGHLAWGWRYLRGENALKDLLSSLDENPPLIADAFPCGMLPKPILPPLPQRRRDAFADREAGERNDEFKSRKINVLRRQKDLKKISLIPAERFAALAKNLTREALYDCLMDIQKEREATDSEENKRGPVREMVGHNTINRLTGRVAGDGGFHPSIETFYPQDTRFWCWMTGGIWDRSDLEELWKYIQMSGYGADASTGKGMIEVNSIEEKELPEVEGAEYFVSLSHFIPGEKTPTRGFWDTLVKFGRLGAEYAAGKNFYKSALVMFKPGSILKRPGDPHQPIGRAIGNVNPNADIVHYAHAFPYPVKLTEETQ